MGFFKKTVDPISERTKALNAQIASLEAQIKKLDQKLLHDPHARTRAPHVAPNNGSRNSRTQAAIREPVFEPVDHQRLDPPPPREHTPEHYNDLGVRKYDLAASWRRWHHYFRAPPARNPKLVTYLATGSIRGLRPLRYEKRVARNRCIALLVLLGFLIWGIIAVFLRSR
jgi:hypothetical protein